MVNGEAGEDVEPSGRPLIDTVTAPLNPFPDSTEIRAGGPFVPKVMGSKEGDTTRAKSVDGGGGGGSLLKLPPPQEQQRKHKAPVRRTETR
jgi:hypothetical protein